MRVYTPRGKMEYHPSRVGDGFFLKPWGMLSTTRFSSALMLGRIIKGGKRNGK